MRFDFKSTVLVMFLFVFGVGANAQEKISNGKYDELLKLYSIQEYDRILSMLHEKNYQMDYRLYVLTGDVFHKTLEFENAVAAYGHAIEINTNDDVLVKRAAAYLEIGILDLSLNDIQKAKKINNQNPYLYYVLGNYCLDMGDMRNALKNYKKSLSIDPDNDKTYFMEAIAYNEMGNYKKSIEIFESLTNKIPQAKYNVAISYLQNDQPQIARELLEGLESVYKEDVDYYFFRAESKYFEKDREGACIDYKYAADLGDKEAKGIYDNYCIKNLKKTKSKRADSGAIKF